MENVIENLGRNYQGFINQKEHWDFFLGLSDYVRYILETPESEKITRELMKKKDAEYEKLEKYEAGAIAELEESVKTIRRIIKKNQKILSLTEPAAESATIPDLDYPDNLNGSLQRLDDFEEGKLSMNKLKSDNLAGLLFDIAKGISQQGHRNLLKDFIVSDREYAKYCGVTGNSYNKYGNFVFSETLLLRRGQSKIIQESKLTKIWGVYDFLIKAHRAMTEEKIEGGKTQNRQPSLKEFYDCLDLWFAALDIMKIKQKMELKQVLSEVDLKFLEKSKYINYANRFHNYLIKELLEVKAKTKKSEITSKTIKKITIIEPKDTDEEKYRFVINDNYSQAKSVSMTRWKTLIEVINGDDVTFDKSIADYFNYNKNCSIYHKGKYKLTNILCETLLRTFTIDPSVKTETISEIAYKRKVKKELST